MSNVDNISIFDTPENSNQINLSDEQKLFIEEAKKGQNILVDACIGSGKTTAIQHLCNELDSTLNILYLTYNKLLKVDAQNKIKNKNVKVTNYHGFALQMLKRANIQTSIPDSIQAFNEYKPEIDIYDVLIIDEYQDIEFEFSELLENIKSVNPSMQIVAVGDMCQKIYDRTILDSQEFINNFLGEHITLEFTKCFRLQADLATMLGNVWNKKIIGVNNNCVVEHMEITEVVDFLANQNTKDILCLGSSRRGQMSRVLNELEYRFPTKFNKKTVYASITDNDDKKISPKSNSAIFTTYDSSKGLERKICVIFDFNEAYWETRAAIPLQKYEILRNIFCVSASRGKEKIIFVKSQIKMPKYETLTEKELSVPFPTNIDYSDTPFNMSDMFDFKYVEDIEQCYSLLNINSVDMYDRSEINIKNNDCLIDLSPCVGIFQEAVFFNNYDIDKRIEHQCIFQKKYKKQITKYTSTDEKILFSTSIETNHERYITQVTPPFVSDSERTRICERLASVFSKDEIVQTSCKIEFSSGLSTFKAIGSTDVIKDNTVYELKFVSELQHKHFLQCACYMVALNLSKGILWNVRDNTMFEISIPDKKAFLDAVVTAITKRNVTEYIKPNVTEYIKPNVNTKFAVIDVETNYNNQVMSIGMVISDWENIDVINKKYFILQDEYLVGGIYADIAKKLETPTITTTRRNAILEIKKFLNEYNIRTLFAYNAAFDCAALPELSHFDWYDIMQLAAYKQYNKKIPEDAEICNTGRLKKNYGVESILRMLSENDEYVETHHALVDAIDELEIIKLLGYGFEFYRKLDVKIRPNPIIKKAPPRRPTTSALPSHNTPARAPVNVPSTKSTQYTNPSLNKTTIDEKKVSIPVISDDDYCDAEVASRILGVRKSDVYKLIHSGRLNAEKVKNKYRMKKSEVYQLQKILQEEHEKFIKNTLIIVGLFILFVLFFFGFM